MHIYATFTRNCAICCNYTMVANKSSRANDANDKSDDDASTDVAATVEVPFDSESEELIPDWSGMCSIPFDMESEGLRTFRAMIAPRGKVMHVPDQPGQYIVDGAWTMQGALSIVHFRESTGRAPELLLSFMDFSSVSAIASGLFVETLKLPLLIRNNVYEDSPKTTKVRDVAGFSSINAKRAPWSLHLSQALSKQMVFNCYRIKSPTDMDTFCNLPLGGRVEQMIEWCKIELKEEVKQLQRQDPRLAEKQRLQFEARLHKVVSQIENMPPEAYNMPLANRVFTLADIEAGDVTLRTPQRRALSDGKAHLAMTRFVDRPQAIDLLAGVEAAAPVRKKPSSSPDDQPPDDCLHQSPPASEKGAEREDEVD